MMPLVFSLIKKTELQHYKINYMLNMYNYEVGNTIWHQWRQTADKRQSQTRFRSRWQKQTLKHLTCLNRVNLKYQYSVNKIYKTIQILITFTNSLECQKTVLRKCTECSIILLISHFIYNKYIGMKNKGTSFRLLFWYCFTFSLIL